MTDGKQSIAAVFRIACTFCGMCRITGCDPALFGAMRGAFVSSARLQMHDCCVKNCCMPFNQLIETDRLQTLLPNGLKDVKKNPHGPSLTTDQTDDPCCSVVAQLNHF
jgi:hypothetical protein